MFRYCCSVLYMYIHAYTFLVCMYMLLTKPVYIGTRTLELLACMVLHVVRTLTSSRVVNACALRRIHVYSPHAVPSIYMYIQIFSLSLFPCVCVCVCVCVSFSMCVRVGQEVKCNSHTHTHARTHTHTHTHTHTYIELASYQEVCSVVLHVDYIYSCASYHHKLLSLSASPLLATWSRGTARPRMG